MATQTNDPLIRRLDRLMVYFEHRDPQTVFFIHDSRVRLRHLRVHGVFWPVVAVVHNSVFLIDRVCCDDALNHCFCSMGTDHLEGMVHAGEATVEQQAAEPAGVVGVEMGVQHEIDVLIPCLREA